MTASPGSRGGGAGELGRRKLNLKFCFLLKQDLLFCPCFSSRVCRKGYIKWCHLPEVQAAGHCNVNFLPLTRGPMRWSQKAVTGRHGFLDTLLAFLLFYFRVRKSVSDFTMVVRKLRADTNGHLTLFPSNNKSFFLLGCDGACL